MLKVYATPPVGKIRVRDNQVNQERQRLNKNGIENVPTGNMRNVIRNRRAGGAGGRR